MHTWRNITRTLGTLTHTHPHIHHMQGPGRVHATSFQSSVTLALENSSRPGTSCPLLLCPHCPPASPTPEKMQLRGPQGCAGNALHTTGQPGYFLSQSWRRDRPAAVSHGTASVFCLSLRLFLCLYNLQSVFLRLSVSRPVSTFFFQSSGSLTHALCYLSLRDCLPTYPSKRGSVPPLPESCP